MKVNDMKRLRKIMLLITVMILGLLVSDRVRASEKSATVQVSYSPEQIYAKIKLEVGVSEHGMLLDENQIIRNGIIVYDLHDEDTKSFQVVPDEGYEITKMIFNDGYQSMDLQNKLREDQFSITMSDKDASLYIEFGKKPDSDSNEGNKPDIDQHPDNGDSSINQGSSDGPQTGDKTQVGQVLTVMVGSILLLAILWKKRKDEEE